MNCKKCGKPLSVDAIFCDECRMEFVLDKIKERDQSFYQNDGVIEEGFQEKDILEENIREGETFEGIQENDIREEETLEKELSESYTIEEEFDKAYELDKVGIEDAHADSTNNESKEVDLNESGSNYNRVPMVQPEETKHVNIQSERNSSKVNKVPYFLIGVILGGACGALFGTILLLFWLLLGQGDDTPVDTHSGNSEVTHDIGEAGNNENAVEQEELEVSETLIELDPETSDEGEITKNPIAEVSETPIVEVPKTPVQEEPKESTYYFIKGNFTWLEAHTECARMGGHLVHFDTSGEVEKVIEAFTDQGFDNKSMFWIGGARNSANDSYSYYWINADGSYGEMVSLQDEHWMKGEPSYIDPGLDNLVEDKMILFFYKDEGRWIFNDEPNAPQNHVPKYAERLGFICEIEN